MASLFALGIMDAVWMAVVAALIAPEKALSASNRDVRHVLALVRSHFPL